MQDNSVTWIELNRTNSGMPMATAYAGAQPMYSHYVTTVKELAKWAENFPNCGNLLVADTSKNIPDKPDFNSENPTQKLTKIPFAKQFACGMKVQGKYPKGYPEGLIVHFTAGRSDPESTNEYCAGKGYTLISMGKAGDIVQSSPLDSWGYHCGTSHQETCIGVEIENAGRLTKHADGTYWSWFGTEIPEENVRWIADTEKQIEGYYEKYTDEQEESLIHLCEWLFENGNGIFSFDNVLGHDEACSIEGMRGRKNDCGGALSMLMPEFRALLKKRQKSDALRYCEFFESHYAEVRNEVEDWFVPAYSPTATENGCVAHVVSALKLVDLKFPVLTSLSAINVDAFVMWSMANGWSKVTNIDSLKPGDICVSGPSTTDLDHVYCYVSRKSPDVAMVLHNQQFGLCERYLRNGTCGAWRFALRMPE